MNLGQIRAQVALRVGVTQNDSAYASIDGRINEANHFIEQLYPPGWDWLWSVIETATVVDTKAYTFATLGAVPTTDVDITKIRYVDIEYGTAWIPLGRQERRYLRDAYTSAASQQPQAYAVEGQTLWLYPAPDSAYDLEVGVVVAEPELAIDDSTPLLPARYHHVLVTKASELTARLLGYDGKAAAEAAAMLAHQRAMLNTAGPFTGAGRLPRQVNL